MAFLNKIICILSLNKLPNKFNKHPQVVKSSSNIKVVCNQLNKWLFS